MKFYRVATSHGPRWARLDEDDRLLLLEAAPFDGGEPSGDVTSLSTATLLAPVTPSKIVAIGLNYKDHAAERGKGVPAEPLLFLKPPSAVVGPGDPIRVPKWAGRVDHEAEMGIVMGRKTFDLPGPERALDHVFGATCVNDVTARDLQDKDVQFTRAKGFDTFCPVGPCVVTGLDLGSRTVIGRVNGAVRQRSTTAQLVFDVAHLVWFVSRVMTLLPGDIISTGTPAGIGPLRSGDEVEVEVDGVGTLRNPVL